MSDKINPDHYKAGGFEVIDIIEAYDLDFRTGNAVKYILRAGKKASEDRLTDLQKAEWYVQRAIKRLRDGK